MGGKYGSQIDHIERVRAILRLSPYERAVFEA
jgi:hypothetical protein